MEEYVAHYSRLSVGDIVTVTCDWGCVSDEGHRLNLFSKVDCDRFPSYDEFSGTSCEVVVGERMMVCRDPVRPTRFFRHATREVGTVGCDIYGVIGRTGDVLLVCRYMIEPASLVVNPPPRL